MNLNLNKLFWSLINHMSPNGKIVPDQLYGDDSNMSYDEYPVDNKDAPLLIFWYGGSWKRGDKSLYRFVGYKMQKLGIHTFIVDYPKYPNQTFPGFLNDAEAATRVISSKQPNRKLFVMGHSAGANTAMLVAINKKNNVDGAISISGPCKLKASYWRPVFGNAIDDRSYDPRTLTSQTDHDTKFLILHGALDNIVSPMDSISLNRSLSQAGLNSQLIFLKLIDHIFILPTVILGPRLYTRHKILKFIFS
jgi:acetyl esterase/lipase